jgi:hypothetical protein
MSAQFANRHLLALLCLSVHGGLTACGGGEPKPTPEPAPASAAPTSPPSAAPVASAPDPEPTLKQITGTLEPVTLPPASLSVITTETQGGHVYLWAKDPKSIAPGAAGPASVFEGGIERLTCRVPGKRHAVAVPVPEEAGLRVRLVGAEAAPDPLEVVCQRGADIPQPDGEMDPAGGGAIQTFRLTGASRTDHKPARAAFFQAMASWLEARARINWMRNDPTLAYAAARAGKLADPKLPRADVAGGPAPRGDLGEMMSLYTGVTSAEEALQTDRGLRVRADAKAVTKARTVALSAIEGVPLPSHPWAAMIAEKKLTPKVEALAALAPADALYLHFGDIRTFVTLLRDVDRFLAPAARALEMSPGEWGLAERYEAQLAVERTGLAEKLGHLAVRSVGVVVGDPLLREGTDVALLFDLENETLLNGVLATFAANAKARHPDAVESTHDHRRPRRERAGLARWRRAAAQGQSRQRGRAGQQPGGDRAHPGHGGRETPGALGLGGLSILPRSVPGRCEARLRVPERRLRGAHDRAGVQDRRRAPDGGRGRSARRLGRGAAARDARGHARGRRGRPGQGRRPGAPTSSSTLMAPPSRSTPCAARARPGARPAASCRSRRAWRR